jgi:diguanylate cyclase (GGDEF)-like protein
MADPAPGRSPWRGFLVNLSLVTLLAVLVVFTGLAVSDQRAVEGELRTRGRSLVDGIILTRTWNAEHGGVFVVKRPGMVSNPYLEAPDRVGDDGTVYTMKNPALMAREISEVAERRGAFRFHLTSLRPLNPENAPDAFEREALERFERGATELAVREEREGEPWFRYMVPLRVEEACLPCHAKQGYTVGQVRGGISVGFSMAEANAAIRRTRWTVLALFAATGTLLVLVFWRLVAGLRARLAAAERRIQELARTDDLTGIANRRHLGERLRVERARAARYGRPISLAMVDVDHFKAVNDAHGHDAGDAVLRGVARTVAGSLRESDLLGRWGGEELLVILPETGAAGARALADRLRAAVEALRVEHDGRAHGVTVSVGLATWAPPATGAQGPGEDALLKQADEALYRAKAAGRNRVAG